MFNRRDEIRDSALWLRHLDQKHLGVMVAAFRSKQSRRYGYGI